MALDSKTKAAVKIYFLAEIARITRIVINPA